MTARLYQLALYLLAPFALVGVLLHLIWGVAVAMTVFRFLPRAVRDALVMFWSRLLLVAVGVTVDLRVRDPEGVPERHPGAAGDGVRGTLLLSNHTSWLDIFSLSSVVPARFVSKAEVAHWPLFGWLARGVGTLFVERGRRHAVAAINRSLANRLAAGETIGIFPEGTTTNGTVVLPFHANLIQPALDRGARLRPVGVRYTQYGAHSEAAAYYGDMNILASLWRVVTAPRLTVELHWLPPVDPAIANRQAVGRAARAAIGVALRLPCDDADSAAAAASEALGEASDASHEAPDTQSLTAG
ncbi:MAG TPA: lysophospholipid acyltransferase family protein [Burkholderiaceae bacterium]